MKVFRNPSSKAVWEDRTLVSNCDLSNDISPWTNSKEYDFNLTIDGVQRKSRGQIALTANDVIALHRGLVDGLKKQSDEVRNLRLKIEFLQSALEQIQNTIGFFSISEAEKLAKIKKDVDAILNPPKKVVIKRKLVQV